MTTKLGVALAVSCALWSACSDGREGAAGEPSAYCAGDAGCVDASFTECTKDLECRCVDRVNACPDSCDVLVRSSELSAIQTELAEFSIGHCQAPRVGELCDFARAECEACVTAVCEQGRCVSVSRPPCQGGVCEDGLLCHIDGTCIERGEENGNGVAVLELFEFNTGASVAAMAIAPGGIVWAMTDTWDGDLGRGLGIAKVQRLDFENGEITTLASDIRHDVPPTLHVTRWRAPGLRRERPGQSTRSTSTTRLSSVRRACAGRASMARTTSSFIKRRRVSAC